MKLLVQESLTQTLQHLKSQGVIPETVDIPLLQLEHPKSAQHGDLSSNIAFTLAKSCHMSPRELAGLIIQQFVSSPHIHKVELAGAGFINFFIDKQAYHQIIKEILESPETVGRVALGKGEKILIEFVSANPTGPLHVGHGRGAAFGASLATILRAANYQVDTEYYVNDAGRQMDILAVSLWLRFLQAAGVPIIFPVNAYQGDYVTQLATDLWEKTSDREQYVCPLDAIVHDLPLDESDGGDKELFIDAVVVRAKALLGLEKFSFFHRMALQQVLEDIRNDLSDFGVVYTEWFSEQSLFDKNAIQHSIQVLKEKGHTYEKEGALWFKASCFGDEKDRVLIRENGQPTYFASDIAYHWYKYQRGYQRVINVFGADHHGYVSRIRAAVGALGYNTDALQIMLVQFATLYRGTERVQMSTRSGSFVTLRDLREEVGTDAARFFYVLRKPEQHMEFDLALAKSESQDNPVYYIQYAYARIRSVLRQLAQRDLAWNEKNGLCHLEQLKTPQEEALIVLLTRYHDVLETAAKNCEPHLIAYYLRDLAQALHAYYNAVTLLCEEEPLRDARLCLLKAVSSVLQSGLHLLGVSAPETM